MYFETFYKLKQYAQLHSEQIKNLTKEELDKTDFDNNVKKMTENPYTVEITMSQNHHS